MTPKEMMDRLATLQPGSDEWEDLAWDLKEWRKSLIRTEDFDSLRSLWSVGRDLPIIARVANLIVNVKVVRLVKEFPGRYELTGVDDGLLTFQRTMWWRLRAELLGLPPEEWPNR